MHVLAVNSVSTLLNYLTEQLQNTPTLPQIQGTEEENNGEKKEEEKVRLRYRFDLFYINHTPVKDHFKVILCSYLILKKINKRITDS